MMSTVRRGGVGSQMVALRGAYARWCVCIVCNQAAMQGHLGSIVYDCRGCSIHWSSSVVELQPQQSNAPSGENKADAGSKPPHGSQPWRLSTEAVGSLSLLYTMRNSLSD